MAKKPISAFPQQCEAVNVLKRVDVTADVAYLTLGVKVAVPLDWYKQHRHDPSVLVEVKAVEAIAKGV